jgi:hypothetical protein
MDRGTPRFRGMGILPMACCTNKRRSYSTDISKSEASFVMPVPVARPETPHTQIRGGAAIEFVRAEGSLCAALPWRGKRGRAVLPDEM